MSQTRRNEVSHGANICSSSEIRMQHRGGVIYLWPVEVSEALAQIVAYFCTYIGHERQVRCSALHNCISSHMSKATIESTNEVITAQCVM